MVLLGTLGIVNGPAGPQVKETPAPSPAIARGPSGVDVVNKALNPGPSKPDVPLPRTDLRDLRRQSAVDTRRTSDLGRQEQGGGVPGLRVRIPADHKL